VCCICWTSALVGIGEKHIHRVNDDLWWDFGALHSRILCGLLQCIV
jgi:hypothetical protein